MRGKFVANAYQKLVDAMRDLPLRASHGHLIAGLFGAWEDDLAVVLALQFINVTETCKELAMVQTVDVHDLRGVLRVLVDMSVTGGKVIAEETHGSVDHLQNLVLNGIEILGVPGRRAADDVVDLDIVVFAAHAASVHCIRELDKDRVLLHDALNVLSSDANDALVVLVRDMERDGSGHLLLNKGQTLLHRVVAGGHDIDVEVILIEAVEDDLDTALAHNLVDLSVLLAADEFLVLIGKLDLDANLVLRLHEKLNLGHDHQGRLHRVVRSSDGEVHLIERQIGIRVRTNIAEHGSDVSGVGELPAVRLLDPPSCTVELSSLWYHVRTCVRKGSHGHPDLPKP